MANAVSFTLTLHGEPTRIHLFGFRDEAALDRALPTLDDCQRQFAARVAPGEPYGSARLPPYYAFAVRWNSEIESLLREAVEQPDGAEGGLAPQP